MASLNKQLELSDHAINVVNGYVNKMETGNWRFLSGDMKHDVEAKVARGSLQFEQVDISKRKEMVRQFDDEDCKVNIGFPRISYPNGTDSLAVFDIPISVRPAA